MAAKYLVLVPAVHTKRSDVHGLVNPFMPEMIPGPRGEAHLTFVSD
jgi:hypothetical protein